MVDEPKILHFDGILQTSHCIDYVGKSVALNNNVALLLAKLPCYSNPEKLISDGKTSIMEMKAAFSQLKWKKDSESYKVTAETLNQAS